jgi:hypothetical protein
MQDASARQSVWQTVTDDHHVESPLALEKATRQVLRGLYADAGWSALADLEADLAQLEQVARGSNLYGVLRGWREAATVTYASPEGNDAVLPARPPDGIAETPQPRARAGPLASELEQAEAELRHNLPQIAEQMAAIERAADEISSIEARGLVERVVRAVKASDAASRLTPLGLLVLLWWMFVVAFPRVALPGLGVLALWYAVARDIWKQQ